MPNPNTPFHPIIYVRGYAMTPSKIDETTADPFCGFNLGSTIYRAVADKSQQPRKYIFQSPVVRLASDFTRDALLYVQEQALKLRLVISLARNPNNGRCCFQLKKRIVIHWLYKNRT